MAQLKDTVVQGSARITDTLYTTIAQIQEILAPAAAGGTTFGPGSNGQVIKSNGSSIYWATLGTAASKGVDTSMTVSSTSTNVPTTAAVASLVSSLVLGPAAGVDF